MWEPAQLSLSFATVLKDIDLCVVSESKEVRIPGVRSLITSSISLEDMHEDF